MAQKKTSAAAQAALAAAEALGAQQPSEDSLKRVRAKLKQAAELDVQIEELEERLEEKNAALTKLRTEELPGIFNEVGINSLGLDPDGNLPGYDAELKPFYSAKLPDDERRDQAFKKFKWLHELTRNTFTVKFGKGDSKKVKALTTFLKKNKITSYENKVGVLPQTLTAEVRRRAEDGQPLPPADMTLLGAYSGNVVNIKRRKS
jgi:hypothetical protein